jgi:hypothetical protein
VLRRREYNPADDIRQTPPSLFGPLNDLNRYTIDACALESNAQCEVFYALDGLRQKGVPEPLIAGVDGLTGLYTAQRVFANPPFSQFSSWLPWAWRNHDAELITMIAPGTRGDQPYWQQWVEPYRDGRGTCPPELCSDPTWRLDTTFMPGRIDFLENGHPIWRKHPKTGEVILKKSGKNKGKPEQSTAMFGIVLLEWRHYATA